jgi:hypothetical protein
MAQFDVHRNSGQHRRDIPFVVVVQSSQFDPVRGISVAIRGHAARNLCG